MTTQWMVLGLLSLSSLSFSQECNRQLQVNTDFSGTDIKSVYSPDAEHCQLLCTQHPSCLFFTFFRHDWTGDARHFYCNLKFTPSGRPSGETPLTGVTSGYALASCTSGQQSCLSKVYQNLDFYGADYKTLFTSDYEEYQRACTHDPGCQFFTFVNELFTPVNIRYKCQLKFSWNVPVIAYIERNAGLVSGFSHTNQSGDPACRTQLFPNTDIPGLDFKVEFAASAEQCQVMCSAHPSCTYFSFVSTRFKCHLKKDANQMVTVAKLGVTSGLPTRFCQPQNTWLKVLHEMVNFRCCAITYKEMNDPDMCQRACTDDPHCQFYTHANENFINQAHRSRCFLKRAITMPAPPKVAKLDNVVSGFSKRHCGVA